MVVSSETESTSSELLSVRLSKNIAARRRELVLTQAQLAERLGVDTETLSRFERGKHLPSLLTLERLATQLLTTVAVLLAEEPHKPDDEAMVLTAWLVSLTPADKEFALGMLKQCCDYLGRRAEP